MAGSTFSDSLHDVQNAKIEITRISDNQELGTFYITGATALSTINEHIYEIREISGDALVSTGVFLEFITVSNNDLCIIIESDATNRVEQYRLAGAASTVYAKKVNIRLGKSTWFVASIAEDDGRLFEFFTNDFGITFTTFKQFIGV